jgi:transposase InsO family protein
MTFRSLYRLECRGLLRCPIVGVAVDDWTIARLRRHMRDSIKAGGKKLDRKVFDRLAGRVSYIRGDFGDPATYERLAKAIRAAFAARAARAAQPLRATAPWRARPRRHQKLARISSRGAGHRVTGSRQSQYQRRIPGGRVSETGYEYLHVMIDDHSRLAYAEVLDDLTAACAIVFLHNAVAWFAERGVKLRAVMSDNGSCYIAHTYAAALRQLGLKHLRIKPYRPRTNGKAERLIQTLLNEWAYARIYGSSQERAAALALYLDRYNYRRRHGSLSHQPPASRLNNLIGNYS